MLQFTFDATGNATSLAPAEPAVPTLVGQPVDQTAAPGGWAGFSVLVANPSNVTFQWHKDGGDIADATGDSLLIPEVATTDSGLYSVTVTNGSGTVVSAAAALTVTDDSSGSSAQRPQLRVGCNAGGVVVIAPMERSYSAPGTAGFPERVTVTATPVTPSVFVEWTGELDPGTNPAAPTMTVTMDGDRIVRARFASSVSLVPGVLAWWPGDSNATDVIGGHRGSFYSGATVSAATVTAAGKVGAAFDFDGTVHVRVPDSTVLRQPEITVEAWLFPTAPSIGFQTVAAHGSATAGGAGWCLGLSSGQPQFLAFGSPILEGPSPCPLNEWTHLAATCDGRAASLYVNGRQVASRAGSALIYDPAPVPLTIGSNWNAGASSERFTGRVDEVALYERALTAAEIASIYNSDRLGKNAAEPYFTSPAQLPDIAVGVESARQLTTVLGAPPVLFAVADGFPPPGMTLSSAGLLSGAPTAPGLVDFTVRATDAEGHYSDQHCTVRMVDKVIAPPGLISWWRAEGDLQDSSGMNHGSPRNGLGFATGRVGQSFAFNGTDSSVEIPDSATLRPASLTLEVWLVLNVVPGRQTVLAKRVGIGISNSYALWSVAGTLHGAVGDATDTGPVLNTPRPLEAGRWYHVAYTFDDVLNQQSLYVDGVAVDAGPMAKSIGYDFHPLLLGCESPNGVPGFFLAGGMDETSVYDRALSGEEIASIFDAGPAGKRP